MSGRECQYTARNSESAGLSEYKLYPFGFFGVALKVGLLQLERRYVAAVIELKQRQQTALGTAMTAIMDIAAILPCNMLHAVPAIGPSIGDEMVRDRMREH